MIYDQAIGYSVVVLADEEAGTWAVGPFVLDREVAVRDLVHASGTGAVCFLAKVVPVPSLEVE